MTREQHIAVGRLLGFPDCCVRQWVDELDDGWQATRRGGITLRVRTREECRRLLPAIHALGLDWTLKQMLDDARVCYVPCDTCAIRGAMANDPRFRVGTEVWDLIGAGTTELSNEGGNAA